VAWAGGLGSERESVTPVDYVYLGIFYFVAYFIGIFFNAAVVGAATIRLQGGDPTVGDGLRLARSRVGKIAVWAAISATVGLILRSLEERFGVLGDLIVGDRGGVGSGHFLRRSSPPVRAGGRGGGHQALRVDLQAAVG
jgi:Family of unknown function (DUF6159)